MSHIDPDNIVVLVRDNNDTVVRMGVADWQELRHVVRSVHHDDQRSMKDVAIQVGKAMRSGVAVS